MAPTVCLNNYVQRGNSFSATVCIDDYSCFSNKGVKELISPLYIVSNIAILKVKVDLFYSSIYVTRVHPGVIIDTKIAFSFIKRFSDSLDCTINLTINKSTQLRISTIYCDGEFVQDPENYRQSNYSTINVNVEGVIDIFMVSSPYSILYDDKDLIDFSLKGTGGSVEAHRLVLAISSPVLKAMLVGPWREAKEGMLDLKGIDISTIQHLKEYIYLNKTPHTGLEELIKLANYLRMPTLVKICVFYIMNSLTLENVMDWTHFAVANNIPELLSWLLDCVSRSETTLGTADFLTSYARLSVADEENKDISDAK